VEIAPLLAPDYAAAPDLARRVGAIVARLVALVAANFLRKPRLIALIVPLCNRLNRLSRRFARLLDRLAAGRAPRPHGSGSGGGHTAPLLPSGRLWLVRMLGYEAANSASQLQAVFAEPAVAALLADPAVGRILRPLTRMLGIDVPALARPAAPRPAPAPQPEPSAAAPPETASPETAPPEAALPLTLPPEPQLPLDAPAWLRDRRPSIVVPYLPRRRRGETPA